MTVDDLTIYTSSTIHFLFMQLGLLAVGALTVFVIEVLVQPRRSKAAITVAASVTLALTCTVMIANVITAHSDRESVAEAESLNAGVLKSWAEPEYGIAISDDQAARAMGIWAASQQGYIPSGEAVFEAETPGGPIELRLEEKENGSFRLVQTAYELKPAGTR